MKKQIILSSLMWCLTSVPATACYLIQTKGAGEFKASTYWREGREIKFFLGDGVMGVLSSDIERISRLPVNGHNPCITPIEGQITEETDIALEPDGTEAADPAQAVQAAHTTPAGRSDAYVQFETEVLIIERALQRIGVMTEDELLDLARTSEALKKRILGSEEVSSLNPLLVRVYSALEKLESMIRR